MRARTVDACQRVKSCARGRAGRVGQARWGASEPTSRSLLCGVPRAHGGAIGRRVCRSSFRLDRDWGDSGTSDGVVRRSALRGTRSRGGVRGTWFSHRGMRIRATKKVAWRGRLVKHAPQHRDGALLSSVARGAIRRPGHPFDDRKQGRVIQLAAAVGQQRREELLHQRRRRQRDTLLTCGAQRDIEVFVVQA